MRPTLALILLWLTLLNFTGCALLALPAPEAGAGLEGSWVATAAERDGQTAPRRVLPNITLTIAGDKLTLTDARGRKTTTTFSTDTSKSPATLDAKDSDGVLTLGIYQLDGDVLTVCIGEPGAARPKSFDGSRGSGQTLATFRRCKQ